MHLRMYVGGIMTKGRITVTCPSCKKSRDVVPRNGYDKTTMKICAVCLRNQFRTKEYKREENWCQNQLWSQSDVLIATRRGPYKKDINMKVLPLKSVLNVFQRSIAWLWTTNKKLTTMANKKNKKVTCPDCGGSRETSRVNRYDASSTRLCLPCSRKRQRDVHAHIFRKGTQWARIGMTKP